MAKETFIELMNGVGTFLIKAFPWAFAAASAAVVRFTAMYINGQKIDKWKMVASTVLALFVGVGTGHLLSGWNDTMAMYGAVASGLVGEKLILWLITNSDELFRDIWHVIIKRSGGKNNE